jgi:hypothetical protein
MRPVIFTALVAATFVGCASRPPAPIVDRDSIRKVVFSHVREVQKCYMDTIMRRPGAEGKVVAGWTILADGKAADAKILSEDKKLQGIDDCLTLEIGKWVFTKPASPRGVDVTYPFFFSENGRFGESDD